MFAVFNGDGTYLAGKTSTSESLNWQRALTTLCGREWKLQYAAWMP